MVGAVYCLLAFFGCLTAVRRSLGKGIVALLLAGYLYGLVRGRWLDGLSQFGFDAALIGFYIGHFGKRPDPETRRRQADVMPWVIALIGWPFIVMMYSPALPGAQTIIGQLAGLHAILLYYPVLLVGTHVRRSDLDVIAPGMAALNLMAFFFAAIEYVYGIEAVIPRNASTELAYLSHDIMVDGQSFSRIPSTFIASHLYGFTMLMSIPFLTHGLESARRTKMLCVAGIIAAVLGIFMAGARSPVVCLGVSTVVSLLSMRVRLSTWFAFAAVGGVVAYMVMNNGRMQRFETALDPEIVQGRISSAADNDILGIIEEYPLGLGLAAAWGTSIPGFMQTYSNPQIGFENEFARIVVDTGLIGLLIWIGFFIWVFLHGDRSEGTNTMRSYMSPLLAMGIVSAFIGVGTFASAPGTAILLLSVGIRLAAPEQKQAALAMRHVGQARGRADLVPTRLPAAIGSRASMQSGRG